MTERKGLADRGGSGEPLTLGLGRGTPVSQTQWKSGTQRGVPLTEVPGGTGVGWVAEGGVGGGEDKRPHTKSKAEDWTVKTPGKPV